MSEQPRRPGLNLPGRPGRDHYVQMTRQNTVVPGGQHRPYTYPTATPVSPHQTQFRVHSAHTPFYHGQTNYVPAPGYVSPAPTYAHATPAYTTSVPNMPAPVAGQAWTTGAVPVSLHGSPLVGPALRAAPGFSHPLSGPSRSQGSNGSPRGRTRNRSAYYPSSHASVSSPGAPSAGLPSGPMGGAATRSMHRNSSSSCSSHSETYSPRYGPRGPGASAATNSPPPPVW